MIMSCEFVISWSAPIVPSVSLAGIPLGMHVREFDVGLSQYVADEAGSLYKFVGAPGLVLDRKIDESGEGGFAFYVADLALTNWNLYYDSDKHPGVECRALHVLVKDWEIYAVKVWMFECLAEGDKPVSSYQGKLPQGLGLGSFVCELLPFTELQFDTAEEWFYTDNNYGGLEVFGCGRELEEAPDQRIMALTVIARSPFGSF